jgi:3-methyladenine DNA glycosylase AlkD
MVTLRDVDLALSELPDHSAASLRSLRRRLSRELRSESAKDVLALAHAVSQSGGSGKRFIAYEVILEHPAALAAVDERIARRLGEGIDDWAAVDTFACYVAGPAWRNGQIADAEIHRWAKSPDRWWRRAAVVSTVALNNRARGGSGDAPRTLDVCEQLADDRDDMVVKAVSWALRELAKRDPAAVRSFVTRHEARLAPRVLREVRNKLTTGLKMPAKKRR